MPILQTVVPQEIFDAVQREAKARKPKTSKSKVVAEVVIPAFEKRVRETAIPASKTAQK